MHQIQLGEHYTPSLSRVKIQYTPSQLDIQITPRKPVIQAEPRKPIVEYTPGNVKVDMLQYPDLNIEVENLKESLEK